MQVWRKCSSCKGDILTGQKYYVCSVSTCQGKVTNYAFCSVNCWDAHVPVERHRGDSAGAMERTAPKEPGAEPAPRVVLTGGTPAKAPPPGKTSVEDEILVVVSKVRKYVSEKSGLNTSAEVYDTLTEKIKRLCDRAIDHAKSQGRKTIMSRDFV